MTPQRFTKTRFGIGLASLSTITAFTWLVLWASIVPVLRGWSPVAVITGSMAPKINAGDIVVIAPYEGQSLDAGAVIVVDNPSRVGTIPHRVVDTTPSGDYVTRGDANGRIDSTPVPPNAIRGVGRIVVPAIGTPFVWSANGQWAHLLAAGILGMLALWTSRWAVLRRYNPWRRNQAPPLQPAVTTIGAILGIWPTGSPPDQPDSAARPGRSESRPGSLEATHQVGHSRPVALNARP